MKISYNNVLSCNATIEQIVAKIKASFDNIERNIVDTIGKEDWNGDSALNFKEKFKNMTNNFNELYNEFNNSINFVKEAMNKYQQYDKALLNSFAEK